MQNRIGTRRYCIVGIDTYPPATWTGKETPRNAKRERLNFTILPVTNDLVFKAAEYKAQYSISYADCFVLASAIENNAVVVTGDPELKKVEHLVEIVWV